MSEHLPTVSGKEMVKLLEKVGWYATRQRGSHIMMKKSGVYYTLAVPQHKQLAKGTLATLMNEAGLTAQDLRDML